VLEVDNWRKEIHF